MNASPVDAASKRGTPTLLAIDAVLFLLLLAACIVARVNAPQWPRVFHFPSTLMTTAIVMFGLGASALAPVAERSASKGDTKMAQRMIAVAVAMLLTVLFLLSLEWVRLYLFEQVHVFSNLYGIPALGLGYFGLTGYFALHVLAAAAWLTFESQNPSAGRLRLAGRFVHLTNGLFVVAAPVLIFSAADLKGF